MKGNQDAYILRVAEDFWQALGGPAPPGTMRNFGRLSLAYPLTVQLVPSLSVLAIERWYSARGRRYRFPCSDRSLRGCLVAQQGSGTIFVDADETHAERLYTISHEIAHFLLDYWIMRQAAIARFGHAIREVLDGERPPTEQERLESVLSRTDIRAHFHLLEHSREGHHERRDVWDAENRADQLALELLAPAQEVIDLLLKEQSAVEYFPCLTLATEWLENKYGLPQQAARFYAGQLAYGLTGGPSVLTRLGLK